MTPLGDFFPLVAGQCPRVMDAIMRDAIRDAAITFCRRTKLFPNADTIITQASESVYDVLALDGVVHEVQSVQRDLQRLEPLSQYDFMALNLHATDGLPTAFYVNASNQLVLGPIPDASETLTANVFARPSDTATTLDDLLWSDWRQAIAAGARAMIRRNHAPWDDPQKEAKDLAHFDEAITQANVERARGKTSRRLTTKAYYF